MKYYGRDELQMHELSVDDINGVNRDRYRFRGLTGQVVRGGGDGRQVVELYNEIGQPTRSTHDRPPREAVVKPRQVVDRLLCEGYRPPQGRYLGNHHPTVVKRRTAVLRELGLRAG